MILHLAVGDGLLDEQRASPDVTPAQRERLLRAHAGVGQDGDQDGVAAPHMFEQQRPEPLDVGRRERPDSVVAPHGRPARRTHGIGCQAVPLRERLPSPIRLSQHDTVDYTRPSSSAIWAAVMRSRRSFSIASGMRRMRRGTRRTVLEPLVARVEAAHPLTRRHHAHAGGLDHRRPTISLWNYT